MTLSDFLRLLRRSWLLILIPALLGGGGGAAVALLSDPVYRSSAQLFVSVQPTAPDVTELAQGNSAAQQKVNSYVAVVRSARVLQPVIDTLGLDTDVDTLAEHISATANVNTVLIDVSAEDGDPAQARRIAGAVVSSFTNVVTEQLEKPTAGGASLVRVETIQPATVPQTPASPSVPKDVALGLAIGLAAGVFLALLRQTLDTKVRSQSDVEGATDAPVLGAIGFDPGAEKQPLIVQSDPKNPRAESFRSLRTNVQFVEMEEDRRTITITSALPSEGKSTTAANLAVAMAENGAKVILVDADLRRPRVADLMGIEGAAGLTDVLVGLAELDDVTIPWGRGGLRVLPAGQIPPNPSELLGGRAMKTLVDLLADEYDFVVFDAPPLLPVTDAAILTRITGGALMISSVGRATQNQLRSACDALASVGARTLGIVMTMVPTKHDGAYGTYYAYYRSENPPPQTSRPFTPPSGRRQARPAD